MCYVICTRTYTCIKLQVPPHDNSNNRAVVRLKLCFFLAGLYDTRFESMHWYAFYWNWSLGLIVVYGLGNSRPYGRSHKGRPVNQPREDHGWSVAWKYLRFGRVLGRVLGRSVYGVRLDWIVGFTLLYAYLSLFLSFLF